MDDKHLETMYELRVALKRLIHFAAAYQRVSDTYPGAEREESDLHVALDLAREAVEKYPITDAERTKFKAFDP